MLIPALGVISFRLRGSRLEAYNRNNNEHQKDTGSYMIPTVAIMQGKAMREENLLDIEIEITCRPVNLSTFRSLVS